MALSTADKSNLSSAQQEQVAALKKQYAAAQKAGDTAGMNKAHAEAEAIRSTAGYSGGAAGNSYAATSNRSSGSGSNGSSPANSGTVQSGSGGTKRNSISLSASDQSQLNTDQQSQIAALKEQYAAAQAAGNTEGMAQAHDAAEAIRASAGYTGGTSGSGYGKLAASRGGQTADQVAQWVEGYEKAGYNKKNGWINGYDVATNKRSEANYIRQQMLANSEAWKTASTQEEKDYLHQQNLQLAGILEDANGGSKSYYDAASGTWSADRGQLGYGRATDYDQPNIRSSVKQYEDYTEEDMENWANDTSRYYNFVDQDAFGRKGIDESSGYTGRYAQAVNGANAALMGAANGSNYANPANYTDVIGDGFGDDVVNAYANYTYDENGNIVKKAPELKNNNGVSNYTNQFTDYAVNGVLQPNNLSAQYGGTDNAYTKQSGGNSVNANVYAGKGRTANSYNVNDPDTDYITSQDEYNEEYGGGSSSGTSGSSGSGYQSYLEKMYAAQLESQLESLKNSYDQNISDLDASSRTTDANYTEQKRQATGENAQDAANWREMANAYGLNSGAIGQAALAQNNQLQSDLNTLSSAQAAAQTEIERQRTLLGQQYQSAINEAKANNDYELAQALYNEAVRVEEQLIQQQQYNASLALQYAQLAMEQSQWQQEFDAAQAAAAATAAGSSGSTGSTGSRKSSSTGSTGTMKLSQAKEYAKQGIFTDDVLSVLHSNGYTDDYLKSAYGYATGATISNSTGATISNSTGATISNSAKKLMNSLDSMRGQTGSDEAIGNSIAVYTENGDLTDAEARYLFNHFGYDPDDWLE